MPKIHQPSYRDVIKEILRPLQGPILLDDLTDQILAIHPSNAKYPTRIIHQEINQLEGFQLVRMDPKTILPLHLAYQGIRFRLRLDREMANTGLLMIGNFLSSYFPSNFPFPQIQLMDREGRPISFKIKQGTRLINSLFGPEHQITDSVDLGRWFREQKVYHTDNLLFTIMDWEKGILRLEREKAIEQMPDLLRERNRLLADLFFALLEKESSEALVQYVAVPKAYSLLPDKGGYPPDHWSFVLEEDGRMSDYEGIIRYSDGKLSALEYLLKQQSGESVNVESQKFNRGQGQQVYKFRAALAYKPEIWRMIEVQGKHTLADFDQALRDAFNHDPSDHLGGFWKLIRRGGEKSKRYREVDLGDVDPFGGGEGAENPVAGIDLSVGDKLKYVYDFGDWIEHILTLEAISVPQPGARYPREAARNQPEYINCIECQEKGKAKTAAWICLTCSEEQGKEYPLCPKCTGKHDEEEHNTEEILY